MDLNQEQKAVVERAIDRSTKIIAGAGTGKTTTLVARYLKFVFDDGVSPDHLLALTFTKKAAAEMYKRVFEEVEAREEHDLARAVYGAWIMNFHQFAFRIIHENAAPFGVDPAIAVAGDIDRIRVLRDIYRRLESGDLEGFPYHHEAGMPVPTRLHSDFMEDQRIVEKARSRLMMPEDLLAWCRDDDVPEYERRVAGIVALWRNYESTLTDRHLIDFDGMIRIAVDGLRRNPVLRDAYANRFRHILVDEFQDTSEAQNELLRVLAGDEFQRVTVVGDEKQSIYRWRDARVENLREFPGDERYLRMNYRSTQGILDVAHAFITQDPYFGAKADEIRLQSHAAAPGSPLVVFHPPDGSAKSFEAEAWALAGWIQSLTGAVPANERPYPHMRDLDAPLGYGDIAILMRSLKASAGIKQYEKVFGELRIPFSIHGGVSALENRVLELFKNVLSVIVFPDDIRGLLSLLESPPVSMADKWIKDLFVAATRFMEERGQRDEGLRCDVLLSGDVLSRLDDAEPRQRLTVLAELLSDLREKRELLDLRTFVHHALETSHFYLHALAAGADRRLIDALTKVVIEVVDGLMHKGEDDLSSLVDALDTLLDEGTLGDADAASFPEGRVRIMTIHLAKGLEFPAVAIPGIKHPPGQTDAFLVIRGHGVYIGRENAYSGRSKKDGKNVVGAADGGSAQGREEEERCLMYVAMTRAQRHLFISTPFAGGIEPTRKGPNNFAGVLEALRQSGVAHEEHRVVAPVDRRPPIAGRGDRQGDIDVDEALQEWEAGRERNDDAQVPSPRLEVDFVSWRGLHTYARCPLQYHYQYVAGINEPPEEGTAPEPMEDGDPVEFHGSGAAADVDNKLFGTFMHRFLYEWLGNWPGHGRAYDSVLGGLIDRYELGDAARGGVLSEARRLAESFLGTAVADGTFVEHLELPIQARGSRLVFQGVVDRLDRVHDGFRIIDYKGGKERDEYEFQVQFYAWILRRAGFAISGGQLCYLREPAVVTDVDVSSAILDHVDALADQLDEATDYHPTPGVVCGSCPFDDICRHAVR